MRVFVAGLCHESSTFSPITTSRHSFESFEYHRPEGGRPDDRAASLNGYGAFVRRALAQGYHTYSSTYTWAQPSAPCSAAGYASLRDEILGDLQCAGPFDMVFLFLHGAQMAQGCDDCEGDLLERARAIVGPHVFIGALLDLHANITQRMIDAASLIAACRYYPHTDFDERAEHIFDVAEQVVAADAAKPATHLRRIPMIGMFYTTEPLMEAANAAAQELEARDGVLSVSLLHGFAWADVADVGAAILVTTNGEVSGLDRDIDVLSAKFFAARGETRSKRRSINEILDAIEASPPDPQGRPFVVADACDNPGGGAGSDSTFILASILQRGLKGYALGLYWDPVAAELAADAGPGSEFQLRLGGKTGPYAGAPLDVYARVLAVKDDLHQFGIGFRAPIGRAAALEVTGNIVVVCTVRGQVFSPTCFTDLGIDLAGIRAVVVKSSQHFYEQFAPLARDIFYCETPGSMPLTFDPNNYTKLPRPIWPIDAL